MKKVFKVAFVFGLAAIVGFWGTPKFSHAVTVNADAGVIKEVSAGTADKTLEITAKSAFLMEGNSGKVLFSKDADKKLPIASMVKVMTLAVIYDALAAGQIKMTDDVISCMPYYKIRALSLFIA